MRAALIGREHQHALLGAHIRRTIDSHGGLVLVTGEPGIGKTTLVTESLDEARAQGAVVLSGACWNRAGTPGYWPWLQVMRDLHRESSGDEWTGAVEAAGEGLTFLLGRLAQPPAPFESDQVAFRLADAAATVLVTVARSRPVIIALDDLHWADAASLQMLDFVVRHSLFERILVVGTYRDVDVESPGHPTAPLILPLAAKATTVTLTGLGVDEVGALMARGAGREPGRELAEEVHRRTGGNPFFVEQLARLWHSGGPLDLVTPGIRDVVEERLARLPTAVREVLTAAAVLGPEFEAQTVASVAERPEAEVMQVLAHAASTRLVAPVAPGRFGFVHDLVRETLYTSLDDDERRVRHAAFVATAGSAGFARSADVTKGDLAHHAYLAVPYVSPGRAVLHLLAAARTATCRLAAEEAAGHYGRAVELMAAGQPRRRATVALALGLEQQRAGQVAAARQTFGDVVAAGRRLGDSVLLGRAALGMHHLGHRDGRASRGEIDLMDDAYAALAADYADGSNAALAARLLAATGRARSHQSPDDDAHDLARRAVELARASGDDEALAFCLLAQHDAIWEPGTAAPRLALCDEMSAVAERAGDLERQFEASLLRAVALVELGDPRGLDEFAVAAMHAERSGLPRLRYVALSRQGAVATLQGRFDDARTDIDGALVVGERLGEGDRRPLWRDQRWALGLARGDVDGVTQMLDSLPEPEDEFVSALRALVAVRRGDLDDALRRRPHIATLSHEQPRWFAMVWATIQAEIAAAAGDQATCEDIRPVLLPLADTWAVIFGGGVLLGPVSYYLGLLDATQNRWDAALERFAAAQAAAERLNARPWSVEARVRAAEVRLCRSSPGDVPFARTLARQVEHEAEALGMIHVLQKLRDLHAQAGSEAHAAKAPGNAEDDVNVFRFDGAVWALTFGGRTAYVPNAKGLQDLHVLLGLPGVDVPAPDLLNPSGGDVVRHARQLSGDVILDETAKAKYRERLAQLDGEIDRALDSLDDGRAAELDRERSALIEQLRAATGLGGRARRLGDEAERSRKTVSARIRDALRRLDQRHPELAEYLRATVSLGITCRYQPASDLPWKL